MANESANPYEPTQHNVLPRAKLIRGKEWSFPLDGEEHRVVLNHSTMGMETSFYVDDVLQFKSGGMMSMSRDGNKDIPFRIGNHNLLVTVRDAIFGADYSLYIDGVLFDGPGENPVRQRKQKQISEMLVSAALLVCTLFLSFTREASTTFYGPVRQDWLLRAASVAALVWLTKRGYEFYRSRQ